MGTILWILLILFIGFVIGASRERVLFFKNNPQKFCKHEYQADKQVTFIQCSLCGEKHWYEKGVDIYANSKRTKK